ncbi:MAG: nonstructural protein [Microviridae sp.]|nr:MAG: nonstructural protein [Microviridae sp.]
MILKMCSIYDSKAEAYLPPLYFRSNGEALRAFETAVKQESSDFFRNPEDYTFFYLGEWDDTTALCSMELNPVPLARAHEVLSRHLNAA